jgi:hypothetical protein
VLAPAALEPAGGAVAVIGDVDPPVAVYAAPEVAGGLAELLEAARRGACAEKGRAAGGGGGDG